MENKFVPAVKAGRSWNGYHRDAGSIVHAIGERSESTGGPDFSKAFCGTEPGIRGYGWSVQKEKSVNCHKCLKKINHQP